MSNDNSMQESNDERGARSVDGTTHPRARNGRVLSGVCDECEEPIYGWHDHADDCPLYRALEGSA